MRLRKISNNRELQKIMRVAVSEGWRLEKSNGGHIKWIRPDGFIYFSSQTPSDVRAIYKIRAALRKAGLTL